MRTPDEIVTRIEFIKSDDFFGFETSDLIGYLPFEQAKPYLKDDATASDWQPETEAPLDTAREYLAFAWGKANGCRGISASRSISHFKAWFWLAGVDIGDEMDELYEYYGKPCLVVVSEVLGVDWRALDDADWTNDEGGSGLSPSFDTLEDLVQRADRIKQALGVAI